MAQGAAAFPGLSRLAGARRWAPSWRLGCGRACLWGRQYGAVGTQKGQAPGMVLGAGNQPGASPETGQWAGCPSTITSDGHPWVEGTLLRVEFCPRACAHQSLLAPVPMLGARRGDKALCPRGWCDPQYSLLTHLWTQSVCGPSGMGGSLQNCPRCPLQAQATGQHQ